MRIFAVLLFLTTSFAQANEKLVCYYEENAEDAASGTRRVAFRGEIENQSSVLIEKDAAHHLARAMPAISPPFAPSAGIQVLLNPRREGQFIYLPNVLKLPFSAKFSSQAPNGVSLWYASYLECVKSN